MKKIFSIAMTSLVAAAFTLPTFAGQASTAAPAPVAAKTTTSTTATKTAHAAKPATPAPTAQEISDAQAKGLVWVNLNTKVYHTSGDLYGKTKHGQFMTKDEAEKAGYHAAKEPSAKKKTTAAAAATPKK